MKKIIALLVSLTLLFGCAIAESSLNANEDVSVEITDSADLTDEEIAQWKEWAGEDGSADTTDSAAEGAADDLTDEERAMLDALTSELEDATLEGEIDLSNLEINEALPDNVINILLLGIDNRSVKLETGRSDAMIICSINKDTGSIKLTSFARDTAVIVPGYKNRKPINTAFKFGSKDGDISHGAELAMKTVNRNFKMNISRYVVVNIHGLADIIESLGGVDMEMTKAEASAINYELFVKEPMDNVKRDKLKLENGVQHLDGMQAVTYGRIRNLKGQNDINRNGRQRALLEALLAKVLDGMDFTKLVSVIQTALPYGYTNLTLDEMATLGMAVVSGEAMQNLSSGGEVLQQFGIPMEKMYGYKTFENKSCIYISDKRMTQTLAAWQEFLYGQTY